MTNQQHPITPPPELIEKWHSNSPLDRSLTVATQAARWGADQELEACCEWFQEFYKTESWVDLDLRTFRAARRPKPPSLKEQALEAMSRCDSEMWCEEMEYDLAIIRTALESLPS